MDRPGPASHGHGMDPFEYQQPILVDKTGGHVATVNAVAQASINAGRIDSEAWGPWLAAAFAKTVRRVTPTLFDRLAALPDATVVESTVPSDPSGHGRAVAFPPMQVADFPRDIARAQVSGLELDRRGLVTTPLDRVEHMLAMPGGALVIINDSLGMSTGKEAAQAAHGAWLAGLTDPKAAWPFTDHVAIRRVTGPDFAALAARRDAVPCRDAGRTEFAQPTVTVLAFSRR